MKIVIALLSLAVFGEQRFVASHEAKPKVGEIPTVVSEFCPDAVPEIPVEVAVNQYGTVTRTKALEPRAINSGFVKDRFKQVAELAKSAVGKISFLPYFVNGKPIAFRTHVRVPCQQQ